MKANEFVKKFGLDAVNKMLQDFPKMTHASDDAGVFLNDIEYKKHAPWFADSVAKMVSFSDLKRLFDSHDLVEECGGLEAANTIVGCAEVGGIATMNISRLKQAIADVESCQ